MCLFTTRNDKHRARKDPNFSDVNTKSTQNENVRYGSDTICFISIQVVFIL